MLSHFLHFGNKEICEADFRNVGAIATSGSHRGFMINLFQYNPPIFFMQILILDSTVFLEGASDGLPEGARVTVFEVAEEMKSGKAAIEFDKIQKMGLEIIEPKEEFILAAKKLQEKTKDRVSQTDLRVIALALQFKNREKEVSVVSDDYAVQNLCKKEKINFLPLSKKGITRELNWKGRCKACGAPMQDKSCDVCGSTGKKYVPHQPRP